VVAVVNLAPVKAKQVDLEVVVVVVVEETQIKDLKTPVCRVLQI
tara:strand:- start:373 stop:504 length:132 start_codon:yes stop_codon:yes gene_type:complete